MSDLTWTSYSPYNRNRSRSALILIHASSISCFLTPTTGKKIRLNFKNMNESRRLFEDECTILTSSICDTDISDYRKIDVEFENLDAPKIRTMNITGIFLLEKDNNSEISLHLIGFNPSHYELSGEIITLSPHCGIKNTTCRQYTSDRIAVGLSLAEPELCCRGSVDSKSTPSLLSE